MCCVPVFIQRTTGKIAPMSRSKITVFILFIFLFSTSCAPATEAPIVYPSYDPFLPVQTEPGTLPPIITPTFTSAPPTETRQPTPTRQSFNISSIISGLSNQLPGTPTPNAPKVLPTPRQESAEYVVQAGDTLGSIAQSYGISIQTLMEANQITDPNLLEVGSTLVVPAPSLTNNGIALKLIPDSELVYGPASTNFELGDFIQSQNGYLAGYTQDIGGVILNAEEIITIVSQNYSVNPRLLLALLEYQSGWVTNPTPFNISYPMGLVDDYHAGLYLQLTWAANNLNRGYYLWRANAVSTWVLGDGQVVPIDPTINAGTAGLQHFFSNLDNYATWETDVNEAGFIVTYFVCFGNPFQRAVEPLVPSDLTQPTLSLPYNSNEAWYYTGGPHGGWDAGSAWAALDFAPPGGISCLDSSLWATAVADGLIVRAGNGAVIQDLDNDGYEQTGWNILYMHISSDQRVVSGDYLFSGETIGHPSCEGGISNATHLHIARKYNGEWISADGALPFNLSGWVSSGNGYEYDGFLSRGAQTIEAFDSANDFNLIFH